LPTASAINQQSLMGQIYAGNVLPARQFVSQKPLILKMCRHLEEMSSYSSSFLALQGTWREHHLLVGSGFHSCA
jgi:hypothetical protein